MTQPASTPAQLQYVIFDKKSGRVLQRHSSFDAAKNACVAVPLAELQARFSRDAALTSRVTDQNAANLDFLEIKSDSGSERSAGGYVVDVEKRILVPRPVLSLKSDKTELRGDGNDKAVIEIQVVDAKGKPVRNLEAKVKVTTNRGKLSEPGGVVKLVHGSAKIALTSTNETVSRVKVAATALDGSCAGGHITLEFL